MKMKNGFLYNFMVIMESHPKHNFLHKFPLPINFTFPSGNEINFNKKRDILRWNNITGLPNEMSRL